MSIVLWLVLGLAALAALGFVFKLAFWLLGVGLFLLTVYALVDIIFLSSMSGISKALWAAGAFFLPPFGPLAWLVLRPGGQKALI